AEPVHRPTAWRGATGSDTGLVVGSVLSQSAVASWDSRPTSHRVSAILDDPPAPATRTSSRLSWFRGRSGDPGDRAVRPGLSGRRPRLEFVVGAPVRDRGDPRRQ